MEKEFQNKDTLMMSDSLLGILDEKQLLGNEETDESLTVSIISSSGIALIKDLIYVNKNQSNWMISYKASPSEVIQSSNFLEIDFKIQDRPDSNSFVLEKKRKVISLEAELDYPGSYICKLVLAID
jgi:hypothetical protein